MATRVWDLEHVNGGSGSSEDPVVIDSSDDEDGSDGSYHTPPVAPVTSGQRAVKGKGVRRQGRWPSAMDVTMRLEEGEAEGSGRREEDSEDEGEGKVTESVRSTTLVPIEVPIEDEVVETPRPTPGVCGCGGCSYGF